MTDNRFMNSDDLPFRESPLAEENRKLRSLIGKMEHDLFFLYVFLTAQESCEEACAYLDAHAEDSVPFRTLL